MAGDSDSETSYSHEVEFKKLESDTLLRLSNGGERFCGRGEGTFVCPFCHGKKPRTWSLRELLQHAEGNSCLGEGSSSPKHSTLAKYILNNDAIWLMIMSSVKLATAAATRW
jgi:hypothetical protein